MTQRVLIYRLGSLGDTVVALPSFHLVRNAFPNAEIRVLTNIPSGSKAPAMAAVLGANGLADGYFEYPLATRSPVQIVQLVAKIRSWRPDVAIYMAAPRGRGAAFRDFVFLHACGARSVIGAPLDADRQQYRHDRTTGLWESESARVSRCLEQLGTIDLDDSSNWDLHLTESEKATGRRVIAPLSGMPFVVAGPGGKTPIQDWGEDNWYKALQLLRDRMTNVGLLIIGAPDERERCERLKTAWNGHAVNLCGRTTPRETAAAMMSGIVFVGHDSGPMHLAAAIGLPCIAIFSSRNRKGIWFPHGHRHRVFFTEIFCEGCGLSNGCQLDKQCIRSISPESVAGAIDDLVKGTKPRLEPVAS